MENGMKKRRKEKGERRKKREQIRNTTMEEGGEKGTIEKREGRSEFSIMWGDLSFDDIDR